MAKVLLRDGKWLVFSDDDREIGRHDSEDDARAQAKSVDATVARRTDAKGQNVQYRNDYARAVRAEDGIRIDKTERTAHGGLRIDGKVARTGIQVYSRADGTTIREYRPDAEVDASLPSFESAPVVVLHPKEFVDADNWASLSVGHIAGQPTRKTHLVDAKLVISRRDAIEQINRGELHEISAGYTAVVDETPGFTPSGEQYDAIQRSIQINHVALGPKDWARGGPEVSLRRDDSKEPGMTEELKKLTDALTARDAELIAARKERDEAKAKADAETARATKLDADLKAATAPGTIADAVKGELAFVQDLGAVLTAEQVKALDGKTRAEKETAAILAVFPAQVLDGRSEDYRAAMFAASVEQAKRASASLSQRGTGGGGAVSSVPKQDYSQIVAEGFAAFAGK